MKNYEVNILISIFARRRKSFHNIIIVLLKSCSPKCIDSQFCFAGPVFCAQIVCTTLAWLDFDIANHMLECVQCAEKIKSFAQKSFEHRISNLQCLEN